MFPCLSQRWTKHFVAAQTNLKKKNKSRKQKVFKTFDDNASNCFAKVCFALCFSVICYVFDVNLCCGQCKKKKPLIWAAVVNTLHFVPFNCYTSVCEVLTANTFLKLKMGPMLFLSQIQNPNKKRIVESSGVQDKKHWAKWKWTNRRASIRGKIALSLCRFGAIHQPCRSLDSRTHG